MGRTVAGTACMAARASKVPACIKGSARLMDPQYEKRRVFVYLLGWVACVAWVGRVGRVGWLGWAGLLGGLVGWLGVQCSVSCSQNLLEALS